jgi:TatD DNase family protein
MIRLFDSHCHLHYDGPEGKTPEMQVAEAREHGVQLFTSVGVDFETQDKIQSISSRITEVFHTVGLHPHEALHWNDQSEETLRAGAKHPKCRAIGEIGLDFHYDHSKPDQQLHALRAQLKIALDLHLPVVIHSREAEELLLPELLQFAAAFNANEKKNGATQPAPVGVLHCFTGTLPFAQKCVEAGFLVSFSGILTFKTASDLRETAKVLPLSSLIVETDCPYLAPIPFRGKPCEPYMVRWTAQCLADTKNLTLEEVAEVTFRNTCRLFRIPENKPLSE